MGHTCNSIVIHAPYESVFDVSNDITRWTELFGGEYKKAEVLQKEGNRITFRLTGEDDKSWQSWRLLFKEKQFAYAERESPKSPFRYMKSVWLYAPRAEGVEMTWIQHFELDEKAGSNDARVEGFLSEGSAHHLKIFKDIIEREARGVIDSG